MAEKNTLCKQVEQLRQSSREVVRELGLIDAKNPHADATGPQIHALIEIDREGTLTVAELARVLNLNQSSTCRTIAELRNLGWVEDVKNAEDRKRKPVQLTKAGEKKLNEINSACGNVYQKALERLSPQERLKVLEAFELYAKALQEARQNTESLLVTH